MFFFFIRPQDDANAHEKFVKFTKAYEVLKDPDLRKKYDLYGESGLDGNNQRGNYHSWNYYQNSFGIYDDDPQVITLNRHDYCKIFLLIDQCIMKERETA